MAIQLICCSHSPLMTTDVEESSRMSRAIFSRARDGISRSSRVQS